MYAFGEAALLCYPRVSWHTAKPCGWSARRAEGELESLPTRDSEAMQVVIFLHLAGGPEGVAEPSAQRLAVYWQSGPSISNPSRPVVTV